MKSLFAVCILGLLAIIARAHVLDHPVPDGYYPVEGDCLGNDIGGITTANEEECAAKCNSRGNGCQGFVFTYLTYPTSNCFQKHTICDKASALDKTTVYYKAKPEPKCLNIDGYVAADGDCLGEDIKGVNTNDEAGCASECEKLGSQCLGFIFTYLDYPTYNCFLKKKVCGLTSPLDVTTMYYRVKSITPEIPDGYYAVDGDCWGQDIGGTNADNEAGCAAKCGDGCDGFVFTYLTSVKSNCYPKRSMCEKPSALDKTKVYYKAKQSSANVAECKDVKEVPEGYLPMSGDCAGNDIKGVDTVDEEACASECNKLEECLAFVFTYLDAPDHSCWLKHTVCGLPTELDETTVYYKVEKIEPAPAVPTTTIPTTTIQATTIPATTIAVTLPHADHPVDAKEFDELDTPDNFAFEDIGYEKQVGMDYIEFEVKAASDARILLLSDKSNTDTELYEIVIGAGGNTYSCLRKVKSGACVAFAFGSHLDANSFKPFVVEFVDNRISVYEGYPSEKTMMMEYIDATPTPINYLTISTGWGSTGKWKIGKF